MKLLTRDQFRDAVFSRDNFKCVVCASPAQDAHHIIERRLWTDSGYYVDNGASVCGPCHILAEETTISCDELRELCGIKRIIVPEHLYSDQNYDKWGNPILPNGQRMKGELFDDLSVQKILSKVLHLFTNKVKYPRTYHADWSPSVNKDDRIIKNLSKFDNEEIVITVKQDGENTTIYRNDLHARSLDFGPHPSRSKVRALQAQLSADLPETWRICGENIFAKHSIHYKNLESHFQVFSIWDGLKCLNWQDTCDYAELLGLTMVPVLYKGPMLSKSEFVALGNKLQKEGYNGDECEGYVVRVTRSFHYNEFRNVCMKFVRSGHVQNHGHWSKTTFVPNQTK